MKDAGSQEAVLLEASFFGSDRPPRGAQSAQHHHPRLHSPTVHHTRKPAQSLTRSFHGNQPIYRVVHTRFLRSVGVVGAPLNRADDQAMRGGLPDAQTTHDNIALQDDSHGKPDIFYLYCR